VGAFRFGVGEETPGKDADYVSSSARQEILGGGCVSFILNEMPWTRDNFEAERHFLLSVIDQAAANKNPAELDYEPGDQTFEARWRNATQLRELQIKDIDPVQDWPLSQWSFVCARVITRSCINKAVLQ
jgi:hypothetical protein